jgi:predicted nucleic acid-binding protein
VRTLVVDASVAVKWQLRDEEHVDIADAIKEAFLRHTVELIVPVIFAVEWANAINVAITRGRFPEDEWQEALKDLAALQIPVRNPPGVLFEAWQIARSYNRTVYDGLYVALAKVEGCEMVTGDRRLFTAVRSHLPWVRWIGDFVVGDEQRKDTPNEK